MRQRIILGHSRLLAQIADLDAASAEVESVDQPADVAAEGLFLRAFTEYESNLERLFFHYVTGGASIQGQSAETYLSVIDEQIARKLVKAGWRFLSWAKPDALRDTASVYMKDGWPIVDILSTKTQEISDCERIRNRIAHNSVEAAIHFNSVQRNLFTTERLFQISPGQLLRVRHKKHKGLNLTYFAEIMNEIIEAIIDPPA
jgi:hypothetical protein